IVYLPVISWAIFFIIDDWVYIEEFVIHGGAPLALRHFLKIAGVNVVIAVATSLATWELTQRLREQQLSGGRAIVDLLSAGFFLLFFLGWVVVSSLVLSRFLKTKNLVVGPTDIAASNAH